MQAISDAPVPLVDAVRPPFLLVYNPLGWTPTKVGTDTVWLPEILEIPVIPGTNGAFVLAKGQDPSESIRSMKTYLREERGLYPLDQALQVPAGVHPAGVPGGSWSRSITCRTSRQGGSQTIHVTPWHVAQPAMPGGPLRFKIDRPTWDAFRLWLVTSGTIQVDATLEAVQAEHRRRYAIRLDRSETRQYPNEAIASKRIASRRADLDAAINARVPEVA